MFSDPSFLRPPSTIHYPLSTLPPIFALADLWMLGWLAAAAAPLLIHLWSRQRYREMPWAAMEYLLAALKQSQRRLRLEQWLLLLLRTLLIVLVVLAVVESRLEPSGFAATSTGRTHRVLVIDGSYSMAYRPKDKSCFEHARKLAAEIVQQGRQGDAFSLVLMAAPPRVVIGAPALEPGEVIDELDGLELAHTTADLPATIAAIQQVVRIARRENPGLAQHEVYFLTDLGRVGWVPQHGGAALAEFRRQSAALAEAATLVVIDVGQPGAENLAVTGLRALDGLTTVGRGVDFEATLRNFGRQVRSRQPVELWIDGRRVEQQSVELAPGGEASAAFSYRFETPGDHAVEVRTSGDLLDLDNHRWLVVPVRQTVRVLCVSGRPAGEPFRGATDYLAVALGAHGERTGAALVRPEVVPESALLERDLGQYDCVFLCDVAQFTASEARALDAYLGRGGSLAFFLGPQVLADRYNQELGGGAGGPRVLPARLGAVVEQPQNRLDPLDYRHPLLGAFRGREQSGLLTTLVRKYFKLSIAKGSKARVALAVGNGDPLAVEESLRRGRVVLVATSANTSWTAMPLQASYVPLVQEMLAWCLGGQVRQRNVAVGEPLVSIVSAPAADVPATMETPQRQTQQARLHPSGDGSELTFDATITSGVYTARFGPPVAQSQRFAVNVDTAESDLAQLSEEQLRGDVWPGIPVSYQTSWQDLDQPLAGRGGRPIRLYLSLLYTVLAMLFLETFFAWRLGYHSR